MLAFLDYLIVKSSKYDGKPMEQLSTFMLGVWREASRHIEITEFAATLTAMLAQRLPLARLAIRRINSSQSTLETVALEPAHDSNHALVEARTWSTKDIERLLHWCQQGQVQRYAANGGAKHIAFSALLPFMQEESLVGPLMSEHGSSGILLLQAPPTQQFTVDHENLCQALLEPCAVALDNDQRLNELRALREAAEADKRSLLTRLGREELSAPIVGADKGLHSVMERVALVSRSDVPVLILGETGSGKEVIARAIHERSQRDRVDHLSGSTAEQSRQN